MRIPDYPAAALPLDGTENVPVWQGGQQRQVPSGTLKGDPGGNIMAIGLFAVAASLLIPLGTNIVKTSGYSADGKGSAEYVNDATVNAAYVSANPRSSFISSNGRGFKLSLDQFHTAEMFGCVGDYNGKEPGDPLFVGTDDGAAMLAAVAWSKANAGNLSSNGFYECGPDIWLRSNAYWLNASTLDITHIFGLIGSRFSGRSGIVAQVLLKWADGVDCVRVQRYNTESSETTSTSTHFGGDGFSLQNITIAGTYGGVENINIAAFRARARFSAMNVSITEHSGFGWYSDADDGGGSGIAGNSNGSFLQNCTVGGCIDGLSATGANSNAWQIINLETSGNRRWGKNLRQFLSSNVLGGQDAGNGLVPGVAPSVVTNGGNRYAAASGQEPTASITAPTGTANVVVGGVIVWFYIGAGGVNTTLNIPQWTSGMTLRAGGAGYYGNANADMLVLGNYTEGGQGPVQGSNGTVIIGGNQGAGVGMKLTNPLVWARNLAGNFVNAGSIGAADPVTGHSNTLDLTGQTFFDPGGGNVQLRWYNGDLCETVLESPSSINWASRRTGVGTSLPIGKWRRDFPNGFGIGGVMGVDCGTAAPTGTQPLSGANYPAGWIRWNNNPALTSPKSWICTVSAPTPTFVADYPYLRADPATGIGYVAGAGGAVTQATSRTTGVTLNKVCGQITLVSAAGSTSWQTLTVTNSAVAATDMVRVCQSSGTDKYMAHVTGVRAGAFDITFATTGGTTTEQPVFNFAVLKAVSA